MICTTYPQPHPRTVNMRDLLIGLAFVCMLRSPAIVASLSKSDDEA